MKTNVFFGGTFNPFHEGHLQVIKESCKLLSINKIYLLPCKNQPLKANMNDVVKEQRIKYLETLTKKYSFVKIDNRELLTKEKTTYTYDTLLSIDREYPQDTIVYVIGSDCLVNIAQWKQWQDMLSLANFLVFERPGYEIKNQLPKVIQERLTDKDSFIKTVNSQTKIHGMFFYTQMQKSIDLSSTSIRQTIN